MNAELLSLDDALACINTVPAMTCVQTLPLTGELHGRFLAADCHARHPVPPFANSAVDGYALGDLDSLKYSELHVEQHIPAGTPAHNITRGTVAEIFTGAALPPNTQAVVMREDTKKAPDGTISLLNEPVPGAHMRKAGEDFPNNALLAKRGEQLATRLIATLAIAGVQQVKVFTPLRVGVFSGGDELQEEGGSLSQAAIRDSNRPALCGLLQGIGLKPVDLGIVRDSDQGMRNYLNEKKSDFDLLIGSAGMSESKTDHTIQTMQSLGEVLFWQLAIKPARPVGLARLDHDNGACYVLGLPGNPASCLLSAWLIGQALIKRLHGATASLPTPRWVQMGFNFQKKLHRREFVRVQIEQTPGQNTAHRTLPTGSATLSSLLKAEGILDLPQGKSLFNEGDSVVFYPFPEFL